MNGSPCASIGRRRWLSSGIAARAVAVPDEVVVGARRDHQPRHLAQRVFGEPARLLDRIDMHVVDFRRSQSAATYSEIAVNHTLMAGRRPDQPQERGADRLRREAGGARPGERRRSGGASPDRPWRSSPAPGRRDRPCGTRMPARPSSSTKRAPPPAASVLITGRPSRIASDEHLPEALLVGGQHEGVGGAEIGPRRSRRSPAAGPAPRAPARAIRARSRASLGAAAGDQQPGVERRARPRRRRPAAAAGS